MGHLDVQLGLSVLNGVVSDAGGGWQEHGHLQSAKK